MTAEALGTELLGEVKVECLSDLRPADRAKTSIPVLDRFLTVFQTPPQRQPHNPIQRVTFEDQRKPPVIEFTGASSCSGKTQLLYYIIALTILPITHNKHPIRGKDEAVVLFDLNNRFSIHRFRQILISYLRSLEIQLQEGDISFLLETSLQHLHVFRPQSLRSLLATVDSLTTYLYDTRNHYSANRALGLLALNELSAFLWQDRLDADEAGLVGGNSGRENNGIFVQKYRDLVAALRRVQRTFESIIIATNSGLAPVHYVIGHPVLRPHMPAIWTKFCTLRLVIERNPVRKFGPGMSAEEATKEGQQRQEAVDKSGFSCRVNWWSSDGWSDELKEEVSGTEERGLVFGFRIRDGGVAIRP